MNRCDGCKFWDTDDAGEEWEASDVGFHRCKAVRRRWRIMDEASEKLAIDLGRTRYEDDKDDEKFETVRIDALRASRAYVQDGSEYKADLFTAPDFSCALHAPQEEPDAP